MASKPLTKEQLREQEFIKKNVRVHYDNRCVIWYNPEAKKKKWVVEHPGPPERTRKGFKSLTKAEAAITGALDYAIDDAEAPLAVLEGSFQTILRLFANKLNGGSKEYKAALHAMAAMDEDVIKVLYRISSPLIDCVDLHKAEELAISLLSKLKASRTHITMGFLVDSFLADHESKIPETPSHLDGQKLRDPSAYHAQLDHLGKIMIATFKRDYDIDRLTSADVDRLKKALDEDCQEREGHPLAKSTMTTKLRMLNQFLNYADSLGWEGEFRANFTIITKSKPEVALNFDELSGMIIGLHYTDIPTCRTFVAEVFGLLRFIEVRQMTWRNLWRANHQFFVAGDATKATSILSNRGKGGNPNSVGKERHVDTTDILFQWQSYFKEFHGEPGKTLWTMSKGSFAKRISHVRDLVKCLRWSERDCGRHTGMNILRMFGIPLWKIQLMIGHPIGSGTTFANYGAEILDDDACASLLINPYHLGLIPARYQFTVSESDTLHLGHRLILNPDDDVHRGVIDTYLPRLHARHEEVKKLCGAS